MNRHEPRNKNKPIIIGSNPVQRKNMTYSNAGFGREATAVRLNFPDMSDGELAVWGVWFSEHDQYEYETPRERSYFRVNKACQRAEAMWRKKEIPF